MNWWYKQHRIIRVSLVAILVLAFLCLCCSLNCLRPRESEPNKPLRVRVGQQLALALEASPTTGYKWQLTEPLDERTIQYVGKGYQSDCSAIIGSMLGTIGGARGQEIWEFRGVSPGETKIELGLFGPLQTDTTPARRLTFTVIVDN